MSATSGTRSHAVFGTSEGFAIAAPPRYIHRDRCGADICGAAAHPLRSTLCLHNQWRMRIVKLSIWMLVIYVTAFSVRLHARKYDIFFPNYVRWLLRPEPSPQGTTQIFLVVVDHFEPDYDVARVKTWN